jgi:hypothetical protein
MRVVLPTPGGPTTATMRGGGSSGRRSTSGTCKRFSLTWDPSARSLGDTTEMGSHRESEQPASVVALDWRMQRLLGCFLIFVSPIQCYGRALRTTRMLFLLFRLSMRPVRLILHAWKQQWTDSSVRLFFSTRSSNIEIKKFLRSAGPVICRYSYSPTSSNAIQPVMQPLVILVQRSGL